MRVKHTIINFDKNQIDKIIESISKHIKMILRKKGNRIRYGASLLNILV